MYNTVGFGYESLWAGKLCLFKPNFVITNVLTGSGARSLFYNRNWLYFTWIFKASLINTFQVACFLFFKQFHLYYYNRYRILLTATLQVALCFEQSPLMSLQHHGLLKSLVAANPTVTNAHTHRRKKMNLMTKKVCKKCLTANNRVFRYIYAYFTGFCCLNSFWNKFKLLMCLLFWPQQI